MGSVLRARRFSGLFRTPFRVPSLRKLSVNSAIQHILSENTAVLPFITIHTRVFAHMVWLRTADCVKRVDAENEAVVREALDEGRGILYLTPHLGCFEITARYMVKYGPITVMYRPPRYEALEPAMEKARNISGLRAVPA